MTSRLHGKTALVTGASQGIGQAIAQRLAQDGASLIFVHYRSGEAEARAASEAIERAGSKAHPVKADLSSEAAIEKLIETVSGNLPERGLDILVLNASAPMVTKPLSEADAAEFDHTMAVNARATFLILKGLTPKLSQGGRVIGFSTPYVERPEAARGIVAASKAALQALVLSLAKELGNRGVTANAIVPGATGTESFKGQVPEQYHAQIVSQTPLGRLGRPEDIADVAAFLVSDEARWITGQIIKVSGGLV